MRLRLVACLLFAGVGLTSCSDGSGPTPEVQTAYDEAVEALMSSGPEAATPIIDAAFEQSGESSETALLYVARGRVLSGMGDHEGAMEAHQRAIELDPELAEAHYFLSLSYFNAFDNEESLASAERAVALEPDNTDYLYQVAQMYDRNGRVQETEDAWNKLLEQSPGDARYLVPLAGMYNRLGEVDKAIELLDRAGAEGEDQMSMMARQLANQLRGQAQTNTELQRIDTALKFTPADPRLHRRRAELQLEAENPIAAEAAIRNAISLEAEVAGHHELLARILDAKEDRAGAAEAMARAVELEPENIDYVLSHAGLRMQIGELDAARAGLERVIELDPESEQATFAREQIDRIKAAIGQ